MSTTTLFGSAEAQAARALVGGTTLGYNRNDLLKQILVATANRTGGTSGAAWGAITGTLSAQTDLQTALDAKLNKAGGAFTGLTGAGFRDTSAVFDVTLGFTSSVVLDAARALTIDVGNVAHTIALGTTAGTITFPNAAAVTVAGLQIANVFTAAQTITAGTLTTAALTLTQTWNNAGVTCRGVEIAITDTNSAAGSTLFRLLGGTSATSERFAVDKSGFVKSGDPSLFTHETEHGNYIVKYGGTERCKLVFAAGVYNVLVMAGSVGDYGLVIANSSFNAAYLSSDIRLNTTVGVFKVEANPRQAAGAYTGPGHTLLLAGGLAQTTSTGAAGGLLDLRGGAAGGSGNNNGGNITLTGGAPTGSGTRGAIYIASNAADLLSFFNVTPVVQPAHIADPSGGAIIDAEARTAINSILAWQATLGLTAAA